MKVPRKRDTCYIKYRVKENNAKEDPGSYAPRERNSIYKNKIMIFQHYIILPC